MRIAVPKETTPGERRVALTPDCVARLAKSGLELVVERGAGTAAGFSDQQFADAGAMLADAPSLYAGAALVARVRRPSPEEADRIEPGAALVCLMQPASAAELVTRLDARDVRALALELVPRITRAQSMDVLSSQATVAGYKAVLLGAAALPKFMPMLTTAAGTIAPARAFVVGAGVAGLMAIATARRLGAVTSAFDVRPAAREQVLSLGATFVAAELASEGAEAAGGYARAQSDDERARTLDAIGKHIADQDLVVTTAQIPGKPAPVLVTEAMVRAMRPGSVIVDLAAESGGNCALTRRGETVVAEGVTIIGAENLPSTVPLHASQMFGRNVETLVKHLVKDGALRLDPDDEIASAMLVTRALTPA
jgi:NAD(P) transhydrogenase subunit alpha